MPGLPSRAMILRATPLALALALLPANALAQEGPRVTHTAMLGHGGWDLGWVGVGAGLSLVLRGPLFQFGLTFAVSVIAGGTILALRAIFERPAAFEAGTVGDTVLTLVAPALTTAALAPAVFFAVRSFEQLAARRATRAHAGPGEGPGAP